jgi:hypothetical protein
VTERRWWSSRVRKTDRLLLSRWELSGSRLAVIGLCSGFPYGVCSLGESRAISEAPMGGGVACKPSQ